MSAQLKAAYDDLVTYLGKDAKGKEKAKRLKDAANELRKKLAAAEEKLEQMEAVKDAARERADELEKENAAMTAAIHSLRQQLDIHVKREEKNRHVSGMCNRLPPVTPTRLAATLLELQMRVPVCPKPIMTLPIGAANVPVFDRAALAKDWATESLCDLGAAVALLSATYKCIVLVSDKVTYADPNTLDGVPAHTLAYNMLLWLGKGELAAAKMRDENMEAIVHAAEREDALSESSASLGFPKLRDPRKETTSECEGEEAV